MHDGLISDLGKIRALKVSSRTSTKYYTGKGMRLPEIAKELGVQAVVEGSVLRSGNRVGITVRLIEAATDRQLWTEKYEKDFSDVLILQSEIAHAIARSIAIVITPEESQRLASARAGVSEANVAYMKGLFSWNKRTSESLKTAIEYFNQALMKDREFARAYALLADSYLVLGSMQSPFEAILAASAGSLYQGLAD